MSKFIFKDESDLASEQTKKTAQKYWRILIVDDDESVHEVTRLVLADAEVEGRKLELTSVYSCEEAKSLLLKEKDFAIAFIDVVMETDHAGLELVEWIRQDLKNQAIRLVLRTGQPGSAPEASVIKNFDINDYKEKTDFTSGKMITTVYAGIRAYRDIITIQRSLDAFKKLIEATNDLLQIKQLRSFGSAALSHLLSLMDVESSALYIARNQIDFDDNKTDMIIACTGKYVSESDSLDSSDIDEYVKALISKAFIRKSHYSDDSCFIGYYETASNASSVLYIEFEQDNEHFKANLAELYATNVALILEGLTKQYEVERTQKDLLYIIGEAIETRSVEGSSHVARVALLSELLARKAGLSEQYISALKLVVPLHDIGKLSVPDEILNKSAKLTDDEWLTVKSHAEIGGQLLAKSTTNVSKLGASVARYHHENWDGSGYPKGLKGEAIPLEARIMSLVDVFDALGSNRCYRSKWPEEEIKSYIVAQSGIKFDPELVELFLTYYDEFIAIRLLYPDTKSS